MYSYNLDNLMGTLKRIRKLLDCDLDFNFQMEQVLKMIAETVRCETAAIAVGQGCSWVFKFVYGFPDSIIGNQLSVDNEMHAILAIKSKKPVIISDINIDNRVNIEHMNKLGIKSIIVIPLIVRNNVWGVVILPYYTSQKFDDYTSEFINLFTDIISNKFENMQLNELACDVSKKNVKIKNRYKTLFNSIDEGICIIDIIFDENKNPIDFFYVEMNSEFKKMINYQNCLGRLATEVSPNVLRDRINTFARVALTGESQRFESKSYQKPNSWISIYAFKIDEKNDTTIALLIKDITKDVREKEDLKRSLEAHDEVFANIAHELKTPLNVIFSANQLMELYIKNNSMKKDIMLKRIYTIKQNCYRFTKLISNIVDLSKIDTGFFKLNLSNENIVQIVEDIVQSVSEFVKFRDLNIIFDTDVEEKIIACDPEKIERIILNLISNAIKFTNPGGSIYVNVIDKKELVQINVRDTGVGIEKRNLTKIFKRFNKLDRTLSRNSEGSGIGLSLVEGLVDLHEGKIRVESEINKGTTFKILLPARTIKENIQKESKTISDKVEKIKIEFSDIYSI